MIHIKYFGAVAEATKCTTEKISGNNTNLKDLIAELYSKYDFGQLPLKFALNKEIVQSPDNVQLKENDEIAVLPPFAGG